MEPVKYYVPVKPVIPLLITALVGLIGIILFIMSQYTFYVTFIAPYVVILPVIIFTFLLTVLLYRLQTGKNVVTAKYFFTMFGYNIVGLGSIIAYSFITINFKKASEPKTRQLSVIEQYTWRYKGNTSYYVVIGYKGHTAKFQVDKLPSPPAKTVTVQLAQGYFGFAVIENIKSINK